MAVLFGWRSFPPTLMPRTALLQGAISGIAITMGYPVGTVVGRFVRYVLSATDNYIPRRWWRFSRIALT